MKILVRILIGIVAVIAVLAVCVIGSIFVDPLIGGDRLMAVTNTRIPGIRTVPSFARMSCAAEPGPHPAVIMIHEFTGVNQTSLPKQTRWHRQVFRHRP